MSGIKSAEVKQSLRKTVNMIRGRLEEIAQASSEQAEAGRADLARTKREAESIHRGVKRTLPPELVKFLAGETALWESLVEDHDTAFKSAVEQADSAEETEDRYASRRADADSAISQVERKVERLRNRIGEKEARQGHDGYFDDEDREADRLEREAREACKNLKANMSIHREAQAQRRASFTKFDESENLARAAQVEYDRLASLASDRREKQRIQEEKKRKALNLRDDLVSLRKSIKAKNYVKFGEGLYTDTVRRELRDVLNRIDEGKYTSAIPDAQGLKDRLISIAQQIDDAQRRWETQKALAEKTLADARREAGMLDRDVLSRYSGETESTLSAGFAGLDDAAALIEQESFDEAMKTATEAITRLRDLNERALENRRLAGQREEIAEAIMQALYDSNYDTPCYYLQDETDEFSDLCVVAAAPTEVGNMKMRIGLSGKVSFEVEKVPEGQEAICVEKVRQLQEKLAQDEIKFNMTDWGRAENQNREHLDVTQSRTTTTQRTIQRQRQG